MANINDNDDFELNEEEQRFNDMLDGLVEEYDEIIADEKEEQRKDWVSNGIFMVVLIAIIIGMVWAGFYYELWGVTP